MKKVLTLILLTLFLSSCSLFKPGLNVVPLQFKLHSADSIILGGIDISKIEKLEELTDENIKNLYRVVYNEKLPLSFNLKVAVKNPNKNGDELGKAIDITLSSFPFNLYVVEKPTQSYNIKKSILVKANKDETIINIPISVDLWEFYKGNNFNNTVEPVIKYGGINGLISKIRLLAKPTIETEVGSMEYEKEISVVDYKFN